MCEVIKIGIFSISLIFSATISAAPQYQFMAFGDDVKINDMNNHGQIVGHSQSTAFIYDQSNGFQYLGTLPGTSTSYASGINNIGQVVGYSDTPNGRSQFIYDSVNGMEQLSFNGFAEDINDRGQIIGTKIVGTNFHGSEYDAYLYDTKTGQETNLGFLPGTFATFPEAVNNKGQVVGGSTYSSEFSAFIYDSSTGIQEIVSQYGLNYNVFANDINDNSQVVGTSSYINRWPIAFLYDDINGMQELGYLTDSAQPSSSAALSINNHGQIVGSSTTNGYSDGRAFLYENGAMKNLNSLVGASLNDWILTNASNINDAGMIIGKAYNPNLDKTNFYLLTPVPEPSTYAMMGLGLFGLMAYSRKRKLH